MLTATRIVRHSHTPVCGPRSSAAGQGEQRAAPEQRSAHRRAEVLASRALPAAAAAAARVLRGAGVRIRAAAADVPGLDTRREWCFDALVMVCANGVSGRLHLVSSVLSCFRAV